MCQKSCNFEHFGYLKLMHISSQQILYTCDIYNVIRRFTSVESFVTQGEIARNQEFHSLSQCFKGSLVQLH